MCGIFGYIGKRKDAAQIVLEGIKTLEYRGYDSWGIAAAPDENKQQTEETSQSNLFVYKKIGKIGDAQLDNPPASRLAIAHTRWATHGGVTQTNAHPHLDCTKSVAVIHNGIIENYDELKKALEKTHTFVSETDSEVAVHMIEDAMKTLPFIDAIRTVFGVFTGSNALVVINNTDRQIVAIRNGSPLVVGYGNNEQFVASDAAGLLPHTKNVHFLEDEETALLTETGIQILDTKTGKEKEVIPMKLTWDVTAAQKQGYATFMEKEIHEQEIVLQQIGTRTDIPMLTKEIKKSRGAYLIGCGTAYYACLTGTYLFSTIAKRHINACIASEFTYQEDFINKESLLIALSQSGETMDLIEAVKRAKSRGATIASIVNVYGSTLSRMSDTQLPSGAGPEIAVASTKDTTAKIALLLLAAYDCIGNITEGKRIVTQVTAGIAELFAKDAIQHLVRIADTIKNSEHLFVVGRGTSYPAALETAHKIKEISYIHAEGLAAGELKHGTLALVEQGTPCIVFLPNDETYGANLAAAMEMKARGGRIIGVSYKNHRIFDAFIPILDAGTGSVILNIIVGQLLAYFITTAKKLDPDKPRNLAKSVTVK